MSLAPGTRLGVYDIVAAIGPGGMGEVYRARDTDLDRDVAIKVLPESFPVGAERVARCSREAKTLAALNHPNIAAIYGLEKCVGITALVMELVEGEDLSEVIARHGRSAPVAAGPSEPASRGAAAPGCGAPRAMGIDDVLPIAKQITDALEAALEQGIVHRDLSRRTPPRRAASRAPGGPGVACVQPERRRVQDGPALPDRLQAPNLPARRTGRS